MKNKKSKKVQTRIPLILRIVAVYYVIVGIFIGVTLQQEHLAQPPLYAELPLDWFAVIRFACYVFPVLLAVGYGLIFRPFWPNFRNLIFPIILLHGIYSIGVFAFRVYYFESVRNENFKARMATFRTFESQHLLEDKNQDGQIDCLLFSVKLDTDEYPDGEYEVSATVTQRGTSFPDSRMGRVRFFLFPGKRPVIKLNYQADPQVFEPYYESGLFEINLAIGKVIDVNEQGKWLLALSRWAPFLRHTTWAGRDEQIEQQVLDVNDLPAVDSFGIMPLDIQPKPITLGTMRDYGVDKNNNGAFEALVVEFDVESEYAGPVYVQALLGGASYPLTQERELTLGKNIVEFIVDAPQIKALGKDGPYTFTDFQLFSRNPQCLQDECPQKIKPDFTVFLNDYQTQEYSLSNFE